MQRHSISVSVVDPTFEGGAAKRQLSYPHDVLRLGTLIPRSVVQFYLVFSNHRLLYNLHSRRCAVDMSLLLRNTIGFIAKGPFIAVGSRLASTMAQALQTHGVVPDVIDKAPEKVLKVTYPNNLSVEVGKVLTPTQVKDQPNVVWDAEANAFYTLCMTDPDAPSRQKPTFREWHHWLVGNIPGSDVSKGDTLSEYIGSGPPEGTGLHRYVFLLYKQPDKLKFDEARLTNKSGDNRGKFSIKTFAQKYKLGDPIAANMYQAEFDDYVPILYKQLGGKTKAKGAASKSKA